MVKAATAIILNEKKILLVKRGKYTNKFPQHRGFPGGRVESGETLEKAVAREVKEEVNLDFKPTKLYSTWKYEDRDLYRFLGDWSGEVKIQPEECDKFDWFSYDKAIKLKLAFEYRDVIEKLHKDKLM